ncbi:hypothetical protein [uncultured Psychroserpens sp.]|uniref:hypothetical protein n=1 Tax=uncultured Psychroserpens sp. TaxID=255436 RepID=UPI0026022E1C|nr:hypothetical protein [uncultured Psychroserpens sp.]
MFTFRKKDLKEDAQYVKRIITSYCEKPHIKKLSSPISEEFFIIDKKNQIYICIEDGKVTLSNHVFLYKKQFSLSFTDGLKKLIKESIESEMQSLKSSLFKNETDLLAKVHNISLSDKKPNVINHNFKKVSNL